MKKVLIVGASGFIGSNLTHYLKRHYRIYGTFGVNPIRVDGIVTIALPIAPASPIQQIVRRIRPDAIVYCAARIDEQQCMADPQGTLFINSEAPLLMAHAAADFGCRFIYFSTSKVFDGIQGNYVESDPLNPQGPYGSSKLRGEESLRHYPNTVIFRLGTVFGLGSAGQKSSILNRLLRQLWTSTSASFISDEYRSFISVDEVAHAVGIAIDTRYECVGTYHLAGPTKNTYFDFATEIARTFEVMGRSIRPISGKEFAGPEALSGGRRGGDLSLSSQHFCDTFYAKFSSLPEALERIRSQLHYGTQ